MTRVGIIISILITQTKLSFAHKTEYVKTLEDEHPRVRSDILVNSLVEGGLHNQGREMSTVITA